MEWPIYLRVLAGKQTAACREHPGELGTGNGLSFVRKGFLQFPEGWGVLQVLGRNAESSRQQSDSEGKSIHF